MVIGLILIPLSIIINKREIEKKFSELNQKILSDKQAQHHKISDDLKKEIKTVIAKYFHILTTERKIFWEFPNLTNKYFLEIPTDFNKISQNPGVVEDEELFRMINNARYRAARILYMARNVFSDQKHLAASKITSHEYLQEIEPIFKQFLDHKEEIFQHLKNL